MGSVLQQLSEGEKKDLAGNTINLYVLMALIGWVGRVAEPRRETLARPWPSIDESDEEVEADNLADGQACKRARKE